MQSLTELGQLRPLRDGGLREIAPVPGEEPGQIVSGETYCGYTAVFIDAGQGGSRDARWRWVSAIGRGRARAEHETEVAWEPQASFRGRFSSAMKGRFCARMRSTPSSPETASRLKVEAGRATMGNAIYRDLIQGSLMVDARFLVLGVPVQVRRADRSRTQYAKTYSVVEAIYGSPRLQLPFEGLLLIGY